MPAVIHKLKKPLQTADAPITEVKIREPNGEDYMELGDPYIVARLEDGTFFPAEDKGVLRQYVGRLVDLDPNLMGQMSLADAMAIRDIVLGFFSDARSTSETPST